MTQGRDDDLRDRPVEEEQLGAEEITKGRDVQDLTRTGHTQGIDVTTNAERPDIEPHGVTVVDRSHVAESRGMDVIEEGPVESEETVPEEDESSTP